MLYCCCSVSKVCLTLCNPMDCRMPGFPVLNYLPEAAQTHVHWVSDAIQPSHPFISFSSCLQSFPASGSFPMSQFFALGDQSVAASASASVLPNIHLTIFIVQPWIFIDAEAEAPVLWLPEAKSWLIVKNPDYEKDWRQEEKGTAEDKMVGYHHWLNGHEFEQALGVGEGQGSLTCCSPWDCKESDMIVQLNWTESNYIIT